MTSTVPTPPASERRKLIEVSIPLEKINSLSSKEKNNHQGGTPVHSAPLVVSKANGDGTRGPLRTDR